MLRVKTRHTPHFFNEPHLPFFYNFINILINKKESIIKSVKSTLGWHSLKVKGEVQTNKDLWWIPRHPETRKGVVSDEMLRENYFVGIPLT